MKTIATITEAMRDHDRIHAPGSESPQWGAYVEDCRQVLGATPYDIDGGVVVSAEFAAYWTAIANRDYSTAEAFGDVNPDWIAEDQPEPIKSLDDLFAAMRDRSPSVGSWDDLPSFGGDEPSDTREIWSWDTTRLIVGTCADDIRIVNRADW